MTWLTYVFSVSLKWLPNRKIVRTPRIPMPPIRPQTPIGKPMYQGMSSPPRIGAGTWTHTTKIKPTTIAITPRHPAVERSVKTSRLVVGSTIIESRCQGGTWDRHDKTNSNSLQCHRDAIDSVRILAKWRILAGLPTSLIQCSAGDREPLSTITSFRTRRYGTTRVSLPRL